MEKGLPKWWKRQGIPVPWPVDIRAYLVETLRKDKREATLMEAEAPRRTARANTGFFLELVQGLPVTRFFAVWPRGADDRGLIWESGILGVLIEWKDFVPVKISGKNLDLFPEEGVGDLDPLTGEYVFKRRKGRTTYQMDFSAWDCQIWPWSSYEELVRNVRAAASVHSPVSPP